jgi:hypothetical protein
MAGKLWSCVAAVVGLFCFALTADAGHCHHNVQEVRREVVGYRYAEPVREIRLVERVEIVDDVDYHYDYADEEVLEVRRVREKQARNVKRSEVKRSRSRSSSRPAKSRSSSRRVVERSSVSY